MLILISNDDGILSEGLLSLAAALKPLGDIWIVAPEKAQSAVGRSITLHRPLKMTRLSDQKFMINGTPSDCVNLAINSLLPQKPALVVSGINKGGNMADDIPYSGTVAAAFEATIWKIPALAVSLACRNNFIFGPAARFTAKVASALLKNSLAPDIFLNVNVPDTQGKEITAYKITHQGKSVYEETIEERTNPRGEKYYWIGGDGTKYKDIPGSDADAVLKNYASITPVKTDFTDHGALGALKKWTII
ncbi:MAG: 5'/3'-nucleotidase SurE [Pseudomonadota bacterium]